MGVMFQAWNEATILHAPPLPQILSEWAAVIPLVFHLSSYKRDYELVGQLALCGRLSVDVFPKLGVLYGFSKLLGRGSELIDQASTQRSPSWTVWDVCWGSIFPCANGGASSMIIRHVNRPGCVGEKMPDILPSPMQCPEPGTLPNSPLLSIARESINRSASDSSSSSGDTLVQPQLSASQTKVVKDPSSKIQEKNNVKPGGPEVSNIHRRMQMLHVMHFSKVPQKRSAMSALDDFISSTTWHSVLTLCFLGLTATLATLGLYGTAVVLFSGTIAKLSCRAVKIERPPGYLHSNETEQQSFMLMGLHQNTCTWYLFTGDRGIVDSVLNKSMVAIKPSRVNEMLALLLRCIHAVQLITTTYVAGSKGWDGVALVILMILNSFGRWTSDEYFMVKRWLEIEGIGVKSRSYSFTGRTMLLGAVQEMSKSKCVSWMDGVIAPHPRREAWLSRLSLLGKKNTQSDEDVLHNTSKRWSDHDWKTILLSSELAYLSAEILRKEFPSTQSV